MEGYKKEEIKEERGKWRDGKQIMEQRKSGGIGGEGRHKQNEMKWVVSSGIAGGWKKRKANGGKKNRSLLW